MVLMSGLRSEKLHVHLQSGWSFTRRSLVDPAPFLAGNPLIRRRARIWPAFSRADRGRNPGKLGWSHEAGSNNR